MIDYYKFELVMNSCYDARNRFNSFDSIIPLDLVKDPVRLPFIDQTCPTGPSSGNPVTPFRHIGFF